MFDPIIVLRGFFDSRIIPKSHEDKYWGVRWDRLIRRCFLVNSESVEVDCDHDQYLSSPGKEKEKDGWVQQVRGRARVLELPERHSFQKPLTTQEEANRSRSTGGGGEGVVCIHLFMNSSRLAFPLSTSFRSHLYYRFLPS